MRIEQGIISSTCAPDPVPWAAVLPTQYDGNTALPLCLFLHGGTGSHRDLIGLGSLFEAWFSSGALPPMVVATAGTGPLDYYLDFPDGSKRWETFLATEFLSQMRGRFAVGTDRASTLLAGMSMGGLGALKIAFADPELFHAVAVLEPTIEPSLDTATTTGRNRYFFYPGNGPAILTGPDRDPALVAANNPANRAIDNADAIRDSGLAIYIDAADHDTLNLMDGAEFLHRVLWDLDISHEYHLVRGADHVGASVVPRLSEAFGFLGESLGPAVPDPAAAGLRSQLRSLWEAAAESDPTMHRRYGRLLTAPSTRLSAGATKAD